MVLIGGLLLGIGLMTALRSNRYENRAMGEAARMGIITFAPEENTPEYKEKYAARQRADRSFRRSLVCTGTGILLQTIGSII